MIKEKENLSKKKHGKWLKFTKKKRDEDFFFMEITGKIRMENSLLEEQAVKKKFYKLN